MIIAFISSFFGLARDLTLSYFYGASPISDAYIIATTIPMVLFGFAASAISIGYIPSYSKVEVSLGEAEANRFTSNLINIIVLFCFGIVIIALLFTTPLIKIFALGFDGDTLSLTLKMTRILLWSIIFMGMTIIFSAYLQIKGNYVVPALIGFPMNIIIIIATIISAKTNVLVLAVGSLIATITQFVMLIIFVSRTGYRHKWKLNLKDENIRTMLYVIVPVTIGISVNQVNILVDKTVASKIAVGGISALTYSNRLNAFVMAIVVYSITTVIYPLISKIAVEKDLLGLKKILLQATGGINLLVIPASFGAMMLSEPIVRLLFGRGAFDEQAIAMTSSALFYYSIGMIGFGMRDLLTRVFFSMQDAKTPMINGVIATLLNIVMTVIFSKFMGIAGIALATSISALITTGLLFYSLRKKIGPVGGRGVLMSFGKISLASFIMGMAARVVLNVSDRWPLTLSLGMAIVTGVLIYSLLIILLRVDVGHMIPKIFTRKNS